MVAELKPRLRSLEIIPFESNGQAMLLLRDRLGIAADAAVPRALGPLLGLFDGTRTHSQIITTFATRNGEHLPSSFVENIVEQLDEALMLVSPAFHEAREKLIEEFACLHTRPAALAGASYHADPACLTQLLDGFFREAAKIDVEPEYRTENLRGIVVPHIDFTRGGPVEALAYAHLSKTNFDTIVILGIAHNGVKYPFCGAPMSYDTPLGTAQIDGEFFDALEVRVGPQFRAEQFAHKNEHSVEFVTVFLQYLPQFRNTKIVPILCGGFYRSMRNGTSPRKDVEIATFCDALRATVDESEAAGKRVGIIASVDLAHIGSRFGDDSPLGETRLEEIAEADREFLRCAEAGDAEALHLHIALDENERNVDAHPALYTVLSAFPEWRGQLLNYSQAYDAAANSVVSFASMALFA